MSESKDVPAPEKMSESKDVPAQEKMSESKDVPEEEQVSESKNSDDYTEQELSDALLCPLCGVHMKPPIQQCTRFHDYCKECFDLLFQCVRCYCPKGTTRNHTLEKLYFKVNLPCKYARNGCEFKCKSDKLKEHEAICTYTIRKCPFNFTTLCSWRGLIYHIEDHCNEFHYYNIITGSENAKSFAQFDSFFGGYSMFMIFAMDNLFRFTIFMEKETRMLKFATTYLGSKLEYNKYSYEVKFLREDTDKLAIKLKAPCAFLFDHTQPFSGDEYLMMPVEVLEPFCDYQGDLHYVIRIIDNDENADQPIASTSKMSS